MQGFSKRPRLRRSVVLLVLLMAVILVAPMFAPFDTRGSIDPSPTKNQPPSLTHVMGTNKLDVDLFSLVLKGSQASLLIAAAATAITILVGLGFGTIAAFAGGRVDSVLMRALDIAFSVPRFLVLLAVSSIVEEHLNRAQLVLLIGLTGWFDVARIMRGEIASLLTRDWSLAARAVGIGRLRLAARHIFPHLLPILVVIATIGIGHTIVLEAGLTFLGAGTSGDSLGFLLQEASGISSLTNWWLALFPGLAMVLIVFACNALGDALRDVFSPEQVHSWPTT